MNLSIVITTINKPNKSVKYISQKIKKKKWNLVIIGDKKSPKKYNLKYGKFINLKEQKKLPFISSKFCKINSYTRKNIGYLFAAYYGAEVILETDDDNIPNKDFFKNIQLEKKVREIAGDDWENVYLTFLKKKENIWPRGLPLSKIFNKPKFKNTKTFSKFYLQQGVCQGNPDVDAIYRLSNKKINIKFKKNISFSLGNAISPTNSQNTIWFKKIFPLLYLPATCSMRATDIWRGMIALNILKKNNLKILFFGTTMFQKRNYHDINNDFKQELEVYRRNKEIIDILNKIKLKKGYKYFKKNLLLTYKILIKNKFFYKSEIKYLNNWIKDLDLIEKKY